MASPLGGGIRKTSGAVGVGIDEDVGGCSSKVTFLPQQSQNLPSGGNSLPQLSQNKASTTEPVWEPVDRVFELDVRR